MTIDNTVRLAVGLLLGSIALPPLPALNHLATHELGVMLFYSGTSEKGTLWDQYKFKWFVPFIEVVLF